MMEQADNLKPLKPKQATTQLDWVQRFITMLFLLPFCGICLYVTTPFVAPEIIGQKAVSITHYPEAQLLYSGYRIVGSSEWQDKTFILWTSDSVDDVQEHFERYFPEFAEPNSRSECYPLWRGSNARILSVGLNISLLDANQANRSRVLLYGYDGNPYDDLDNAPRYGTLILITHNIFAP